MSAQVQCSERRNTRGLGAFGGAIVLIIEVETNNGGERLGLSSCRGQWKTFTPYVSFTGIMK